MFRLFCFIYCFLFIRAKFVEESEWVIIEEPPGGFATPTSTSEAVIDLAEFQPQPHPTPIPEVQPRQLNQSSREEGGYLFDGPTNDVVAFYRAQQVQKLKRLLFIVVIDGGSSKTAGFLWQTSVISEMGKTPIANWKNMIMKEVRIDFHALTFTCCRA